MPKRNSHQKDAEIEKLKKQFQRLADTVEFDGYKYDKDSSPKGAPYCPVPDGERTGRTRDQVDVDRVAQGLVAHTT
jgi:hypothetical protein